jgi:outer membrane receptor protein involved in Fe transport
MRQRFKWHIVLLALLVTLGIAPSSVWAALTGKIAGRVSDQAGTPLPGVAVFVQGRQLGATTDRDGRYFILQVPPGTYTVEASLVGYQSVRLQNVTVNMDRSTEASYTLRESTIEVDAITVVAERPIVQQDVTSTQLSVTTQQAEQLPVNTLLDAIGFQAGIDIQNKTSISVRGSSPDQINFQVDGFQQSNPIENRSYTTMNQALIQEVQVLTGAFTAEYFSRAAVINVVTRDPGQSPNLTGDFRYIPARKQHFGVGAYDDSEFDRLVYRRRQRQLDESHRFRQANLVAPHRSR